LIGRFLVVCLCSACCDLSLHGGGVLGGPGGSGGVLGCRVEPDDRPGGGTGGALTGGRTLDEDPEDFGADDCLRDTGAALKRTGLGVAVGPCGGVTGALAGAGGGFGTSAFGR